VGLSGCDIAQSSKHQISEIKVRWLNAIIMLDIVVYKRQKIG